MKTTTMAIGLLLLCILAALPIFAQQGPDRPLPGKVVTVEKKAASLVLYLRATKDAPGKPPAEMVQQAATLLAQADRLERAGKTEAAARIRKHVDELLCWRELNFTVPDLSRINLLGQRKESLDALEEGLMVRLVVTVDGRLRRGEVPARATLASDIDQRPERAVQRVRQLPDVPGSRAQFVELLGEVVNLDPLKIAINDATVEVATSEQFRFIAREPISPREVQAGVRILAMAAVAPDLRVTDLRSLIVLFDNTGSPFEPGDENE